MKKKETLPPDIIDVYLEEDARRYRWLRQQKGLVLASDNTIWKKPNGLDTYVSSHKLFANGVQYAPAPTLDELIDKAMTHEHP